MRALLPHRGALLSATYVLDGCINYGFAEDPFDPDLIGFSELWPDREVLDRHLPAPHIGSRRLAAKACGLIERSFTAYSIAGS